MNYGKNSLERRNRELSSPRRSFRRWLSITILRVILVFVAICAVIIIVRGFSVSRQVVRNAPDLSLVESPPVSTTRILDADGNEIASYSSLDLNNEYVTLSVIPDNMQKAFIAYLDPNFRNHNGVEVKEVIRALAGEAFYGSYSVKSSTITEQLVSNSVYLGSASDGSQAGIRKLMQMQYLASQLEKKRTKDWILEHYLNSIDFGDGIIGVASASERYFGKSVSDLTVSESAVLAAMVHEPSGRSPVDHKKENAVYRKKVLQAMKREHYLTREACDRALQDDVYSRITDTRVQSLLNPDAEKTAFVTALKDSVIADLQKYKGYTQEEADYLFYRGGLTVYATQDSSIQSICTEAVKNQIYTAQSHKVSLGYSLMIREKDGTVSNYSEADMLKYYKKLGVYDFLTFDTTSEARRVAKSYKTAMLKKGGRLLGEEISYYREPEVSVTIMSPSDGKILAMIGGRESAKGNGIRINRATDLRRKSGTALQLFSAFIPALDSGDYSLSSTPLADETDTGKEGENWEQEETIREGIIGEDRKMSGRLTKSLAEDIGTESMEEFGLQQAGGGTDAEIKTTDQPVSNLSLTNAFAAIASGGTYTRPVYYTRILDQNHEELLGSGDTRRSRSVIKATTAYMIEKVLQDSASSMGDVLGNTDAAAHEYISENAEDSWFVGFSPRYVCTVWGGFDSSESMESTEFTDRIWSDIMQGIHENQNAVQFTVPDGIVKESICALSGEKAIRGICPHTQTEYYTENTKPSEECSRHITAIICKESGLLAGNYCPKADLEKQVFDKYETDPARAMPEQVCNVHKK